MADMTTNPIPSVRASDRPDVLTRIGNFFAALRGGYAAARDFEHLEHMSDEALARKGLTRSDAMRRLMERNFG